MERAQRLRAAQYRLAQHYLEKLQAAERAYQLGGEIAAQALTMFDLEREQVRLQQAWVAAHAGEDEQAAALCSAYAGTSPHLYNLRLLPQEYLSLLEAGLVAARQLGDRRMELKQLLVITEIHIWIVEYDRAFEYGTQALSLARLIHDEPLLALSLNMYGNAVRNQSKFEEAQTVYEESLLLHEKIGDRRGMADVLNNLGVLAITTRRHDAAQRYLERSLSLNREIGNQEGVATCLNNLGFLANRLEHYLAARDYLEQAVAICRALEDKPGLAMVLTNLGLAAYYQQAYALAKDYLEQSLDAARASGTLRRELISLYRSGEVAMALGDLISAQAYFEQGLTRDPEGEFNPFLPIGLSNLAIIYQRLHQEERVRPTLQAAWKAVSRFPVEYTLEVLCGTARLWALQGKAVQAATWIGLLENHAHPAVKMASIKQSIRFARAECEAALSPEQFASAWEAGKTLNLETVVAELLNELKEN